MGGWTKRLMIASSLYCGVAMAEVEAPKMSTPQPIPTMPSMKKPISRIAVGANYTHIRMKPRGHSAFDGDMGGAQGLYEYRPMDDFYAGAKLAWKQGTSRSHAGRRSQLYIDTQERMGYTVSYDHENGAITFFSGLGFRHNGQNYKPKSGDDLSFYYNEFYVPVGVTTECLLNDWFSCGISLIWMPQFYPTVTIVPLDGARWILENKINNFYVEVPWIFAFTSDHRWTVTLTPFYEHWQDGHSTAKVAGVDLGLPGNTYNYWGIDLNVTLAF